MDAKPCQQYGKMGFRGLRTSISNEEQPPLRELILAVAMKLILAQSSIRILLVSGLALASLSVLADDSVAQLRDQVRKARTDYGVNNPIQYAPDDPSTRSRLFNLQTGHAGAWYNCDGEECKRNSPHICWKTAHGDRLHRTFWDVTQWGRDKQRIAQRICDGGCCASKTAKTSRHFKKSCGCAACAGQGVAVAVAKTTAQSPLKLTAKNSSLLRPKANVAGLVVDNAINTTQVAKTTQIAKATLETPECDCLACRGKRSQPSKALNFTGKATPKSSDATSTSKSRSASLLDRARSSRKR